MPWPDDYILYSISVEDIRQARGQYLLAGRELRIRGTIVPLDITLYPSFAQHGLKLRNRIIWHFEYGLALFAQNVRASLKPSCGLPSRMITCLTLVQFGRRIKYPDKKYFKGTKAGQYSCNLLVKNHGDVWAIFLTSRTIM